VKARRHEGAKEESAKGKSVSTFRAFAPVILSLLDYLFAQYFTVFDYVYKVQTGRQTL